MGSFFVLFYLILRFPHLQGEPGVGERGDKGARGGKGESGSVRVVTGADGAKVTTARVFTRH